MVYPDYIFAKALATAFLIIGIGLLGGDREGKGCGMIFFISSIILFGFGFSVPQRIANTYKEATFQEHLENLKHSSLVKVISITNTNYLYELYLKDGTIIKYKTLHFEEKFAPKYLANFCKDTIIYYPADKSKRVTEIIDNMEHPNEDIDTDFYAKCIRNTTLIYTN